MAMAKGKGGEGMESLAEMMKGAGMDLPEGMDMEKMMKMAEAGEGGEPPTPEEVRSDDATSEVSRKEGRSSQKKGCS